MWQRQRLWFVKRGEGGVLRVRDINGEEIRQGERVQISG